MLTKREFARLLEHSLLKPELTLREIEEGCVFAAREQVGVMMVQPYFVPLASRLLVGTDVKVATVIGFPLGCTTTATKVFEAQEAVSNGADELDMVMNIGRLKSRDEEGVKEEIRAVVSSVPGRTVKVILETGLLTKDEIVIACRLAMAAGAHFVKTSTGFSHGGATIEDVALMRKTVGHHLKVKASGGIRTLSQALSMIAAGADRIGLSSTPEVLGEWTENFPGPSTEQETP